MKTASGDTSTLYGKRGRISSIQIVTEALIDRPAADVWRILGDGYSEISKWARAVTHSEGPAERSCQVGDVRSCTVAGMGELREKITEFDPTTYVLAYEVTEGLPPVIRKGSNSWRLAPEGERTRLLMTGEAELRFPFGLILAPFLRLKLGRLFRDTVEDLKHYVETGQPHPRKRR